MTVMPSKNGLLEARYGYASDSPGRYRVMAMAMVIAMEMMIMMTVMYLSVWYYVVMVSSGCGYTHRGSSHGSDGQSNVCM